jgi:hypothetical protein
LPHGNKFALDLSAGTSAAWQRRENARITLTDSRRTYANGIFGGCALATSPQRRT